MKTKTKAKKKQIRKNKYKWLFKIILPGVIVFILVLVYLNYLFVNPQRQQVYLYAPTNTPTPSPKHAYPTPTPLPAPQLGQIPSSSQETLSTWKQFANTKYGYTVLYPPTMIPKNITDKTTNNVNESYSMGFDIQNDHGGVPIFLYINVLPIVLPTGFNNYVYDGPISEEMKKLFLEKPGSFSHDYEPLEKTDDVTVDSIHANAIAISSMYLERKVILEHNGMYYILGSFMNDSIFKQFLSTFKFTN